MAGLWETWTTSLRLAWMGPKAKAIMGGFAAVMADRSGDDADAAVKFRFPEKTGDVSTLPIIGSGRLLDQGPNDSAYGNRLVNWIQQWQYAGSPLGMLIALHFAGFSSAVIVQQNGLAYSLTLPLPPFGPGWDPSGNMITTPCSQLAVALTSNVTPPTTTSSGRSVPEGAPWWLLDSDTDYCSRFVVLFPTPTAPFYTLGRATFSNSSSATLTWANAFPDATYQIVPGKPVITDGSGVFVTVAVDGTTKTGGGATVYASGEFTGYVDVLAFQAGANPFADLHPVDLRRLQSVIGKWRPAKARCMGVYVATQGKFMGWPVQAQQTNTMGTATIVQFSGA